MSAEVSRERLVSRLLGSKVGLIEAGAGYGKSVLASQYRRTLGIATVHVPLGPSDRDPVSVVSSLRRGLQAAGLSDLLAATADAQPEQWLERLLDTLPQAADSILFVFDDAHHLAEGAGAGLLVRLARALPERHRLLIASRSLVRSLEPIWGLRGAERIDTAALAFTAPEASELVAMRVGRPPSDSQARALVSATHGWATALVLALARGEPELKNIAPADLIGSPLRSLLEQLGTGDREALIQLAWLPFLSPELCDRLAGGGGAFERLIAAGVPIARTDSGWWELPGPVADYLRRGRAMLPASATAAATLYARQGDILTSVRVLLAAGLASEAALLLAELPGQRAEQLGVAAIRRLVEELPDEALAAHPRVLLHLARVADTAHEAEERGEALRRAAELVPGPDAGGDDSSLRRELDAELARDHLWDERERPLARKLAESVLERAREDELVARARALDVLGRLESLFSPAGPQPECERHLLESARLARQLGERTWAAQALTPLVVGYYWAICRFEQSLEVLDEVLAELPARNRYRVMVQTFRAELLTEVGRFPEAEASIDEMREIGEALKERWILAYACWNEANLASYRGDAAGTVRAVREAERYHDDWFEQASGVEFLSQAADYLSRVGEDELALQTLRRARARMQGVERPVRFYGAAVLARSGDPTEAWSATEEALHAGDTDPHDRWALLVLRAHVARRLGRSDAAMLAAEAFDNCAAIGHPEGPLLREPGIAGPLLELAAAAGSRAAIRLGRDGGSLSVSLLGGFEVRRAGRRIELGDGMVGKLVRIVALAQPPLHVEQLIEILWPDSPPAVARNRLRNLFSRLRALAGELISRSGDTVTLAAGVEVDAGSFESVALEALRAHADARLRPEDDGHRRAVGLARTALERYRGDLAPADRYEPWSVPTRERLRSLRLDLLDMLAESAQADGEIDEAARLLRQGIEAEPHDEHRYLRLARLLSEHGRAGSARSVLLRARIALADLGLELSGEAEALERSLGGGSTRGRPDDSPPLRV